MYPAYRTHRPEANTHYVYHKLLYSFQASDAKQDVRLHDLFLVCLFAPDLVWQDVGDLLDPNYLQTLKAGERERERVRETSACIPISCNLQKYCVSVLKMILGDASRAHPLLHEKFGYSTVLMLCMLSIACPNV